MAEETLAHALPLVLGHDNAARNAAEQTIVALRASNASAFMAGLQNLSSTMPDPHHRKLAAVLFRRNVEKALWDSVDAAAQESIKTKLLASLSAEVHPHVKKAISESISKLASVVCAKGSWNELLPVVFQLSLSDDQKHIGLALFSSLCSALPDNALLPILPHALPIISNSLVAAQSMLVRSHAVRAFCGLVSHVEDSRKAEREALQTLLGPCLQVLADSLQQGDNQSSRNILSDLIDLAASDATILRPILDQLFSATLETCNNESFKSDIRHLCLELFLTLCESKSSLARKVPHLVERAVPVMLKMMVSDQVDVSDWAENVGDKEDDDEDDESVRFGEEALERLISSIGGNRVVPAVLAILPASLQSPAWSHRNAAFHALVVLVGSADKALKSSIGLLTQWSVAGLRDEHCLVKHSAAGAIAALCTCFGPEVQNNHHGEIVPALIAMLDSSVLPRLRSRAAKCVVDFTSECGDDELPMIQHYSDVWMGALSTLLCGGSVPQQCAAIPAVSSMAAALQNQFSRFYSQFLPAFLSILANTASPEARSLRGPAMECISCMADAVGSQIFSADAPQVMELLIAPNSLGGPDDPNTGYLLQASSRIAQCMGQKFSQYLPRLLPLILSLAELDPKLQMGDAADDDGCGDDEAAVVQIKGLGKMRVSINIKELEDKALGLRTLGTMASALEHEFLPYLSKAAELMVPCITYKLSDAVRSAAVDHMESLLRVARSSVSQGLISSQDMELLWRQMFPLLMQAAIAEPDAESQASIFEAIAECINTCGQNCLAQDQQQTLCKVIHALLEDMLSQKKKSPDDDDEESEDIDEVEFQSVTALLISVGESAVLSNIVEVLSAVAKTHGAAWVPAIQSTVLPLVGRMLTEKCSLAQRQAALHVLVDLIEFGGQGAQPLLTNVCLACIQFSADANSTVRRAACYGLAVCAQHGQADMSPLLPQALTCLHAAATRGRSGDEDDDADFDAARDNAVDAVGRICRYHGAGGQIDMAGVLGAWAAWLPLPADEECNASAADYLASLLEAPLPPPLSQHAAALREAAARVLALPGAAALAARPRLAAALAAA